MAADADLRVILRLRDQASRGMKNFGASVKKVQGQLREAAVVMGAFAAAGILIGRELVRAFSQFDTALARTGAITEATGEQMQLMTDVARELGRTTVFTAGEAANALTFLAMAGLSVDESISALPGVLTLAASAGVDLATSADIATNVLTGMGFAVEELGRVNDVLTKTFISSNTNLIQLAEALKISGPVAVAAGISFEETSAALALMASAGFRASLAGTALRGAIVKMLTPTGEAQRTIDQLGITFLDSAGNLLPLVNIIKQLEESGITAGQAMTIFGQRAGPAMLALISQGSGALVELQDELENSGGTAEVIAERMLNTFGGSMTKMSSAVDGLKITLGEALAPAILIVAKVLTELVTIVEKIPGPILIFVASFAAVVVASLAVAAGIAGLIAIWPILAGIIGLATFKLVLFNIALGPVGLIALGIALIIAGLVTVWALWGDQIKSAAGRLKDFLRIVLQLSNPLTAIATLIETATGFDIPGIKGFQKGGRAPGGPILVGENGPELISPPAGSRITPMGRMAGGGVSGGGGGGGVNIGSINVTVQGSVGDRASQQTVGREVARQIEQSIRENIRIREGASLT